MHRPASRHFRRLRTSTASTHACSLRAVIDDRVYWSENDELERDQTAGTPLKAVEVPNGTVSETNVGELWEALRATPLAAARAEIRGDDPVAARAIAGRIWDRTPGTAPPTQMANQLGMVFAKLNCKPRWRERLPEIEVPTLVVHGRRDPFFPVGNGEAIAREIPGARLLVLEEAATAIPDAAAGEVAEAMVTLG
jgi:pimeloyl-ACP methyl ester carboxylesterase